jgi:hypothetical protein
MTRSAEQLEPTPVDDLYGIPYPLYPESTGPPGQCAEVTGQSPEEDWHHAFHPRADVVNIDPIAGLALRTCRKQWGNYRLHHNRYHHTYRGPGLPSNTPIEDIFTRVVWATIGLIPDHAIKFDPDGSPKEVSLTPRQRTLMLKSGSICVERTKPVRVFLLAYVALHGQPAVTDVDIDKFLDTKDRATKDTLCSKLISVACHAATRPLREKYELAEKRRLVPHRQQYIGSVVCGTLIPHDFSVVNYYSEPLLEELFTVS